jgi:hypothetical protein
MMERPDLSLTGEALKEDIYRKACMRDGAVILYDRILTLSDPHSEDGQSDDAGEIDLFG